MSRLYRARQQVVRRVEAGSSAAGVDGPDEHPLARRGLIAVGPLARDGQGREVLRRHARPQRDVLALVERPDRDEHAGGVAQPRLVEAPSVEAGKARGVELDPPARGGLGERRLARGSGQQVGRCEGGVEALGGGAPSRGRTNPIATASTAAAPAPTRMRRRAIGTRRARRCASMRARRLAGASTSAAAARTSSTARCCSASRSASSEDSATCASSAARRSGASDPSASAASSAIS